MKIKFKQSVSAFITLFTLVTAQSLLAHEKTAGEKVDQVIDKTEKAAESAKDKAKELANEAKEKAKEAADKAKELADNTKEKAKEAKDKAKEKAHEGIDTL